MALKKSTTPVNVQEKQEVRVARLAEEARLVEELENIRSEIKKLEQRKIEVRDRIAILQLFPFNPGDTVLCEVSSGRYKELKRCIIEVEDGVVYVRPYKKDADELSGRHFSIMPTNGSYTSVFKRCD